MGSLDTKPEEQSTTQLIATAFGPVFFVQSQTSASGLLFYLRENVLLAQPFDPGRVALTGDPVQVALPVGSFIDRGLFFVSRHGTIVYTTAARLLTRQLTWLDRGGAVLSTVGSPAPLSDATLSPDGTKAAVAILDLASASARYDVWIWDLARGTQTLFSTGASDSAAPDSPVWSQDSTRLAFIGEGNGLYERPVTALEDARLLLRATPGEQIQPTSWSPDGRWIFLNRHSADTGSDIWALSRADGSSVPLMRTRAVERDAQVSPDGKWIAYTVSPSVGESDVYVTGVVSSSPALKASGGPWRVSSAGGRAPQWRADSRELYYATNQSVMAVQVFTDTGFTVGPATALPAGDAQGGTLTRRLGLVAGSADGKRFLYARPVDTRTARAPMNVLLNWTPPGAR